MDIFDFLSREVKVFLISALPVIELRGAIPVAISLGMNPIHAALLCIVGSMMPVPFLLFFLKPFFNKLRRVTVVRKFETWLINRTERKAKNVKKYSILGLALFVAVPLPSTGVWTGAIAASLFNMRIKHAFLAIFAGNVVAAFIVTFLSHIAVVQF
ncbi:MAG: hypothetical protein PWQ37_2766 [Candidatus Petromonas sp.]|nr:hypothetical protein [Candidatus Petromonas sp.]